MLWRRPTASGCRSLGVGVLTFHTVEIDRLLVPNRYDQTRSERLTREVSSTDETPVIRHHGSGRHTPKRRLRTVSAITANNTPAPTAAC